MERSLFKKSKTQHENVNKQICESSSLKNFLYFLLSTYIYKTQHFSVCMSCIWMLVYNSRAVSDLIQFSSAYSSQSNQDTVSLFGVIHYTRINYRFLLVSIDTEIPIRKFNIRIIVIIMIIVILSWNLVLETNNRKRRNT